MARLVVIGSGYLLTAIWPRRWDRQLVDRLSETFYHSNVRVVRRLASRMAQVLGHAAAGRDLHQIARNHYHMRIEDGWGRLRDLHRRGWEPHIEIEGLDRVRQGLARGQAVILWGMMFCGSTVPKAGLWRSGIRLIHLSREDHGAPSLSRVGLAVAAPLYCRAETRYLERRIVLPLDGGQGLRELMDRLDTTVCVSITGEITGRQNVTTEFFGGRAKFATGAPSMAWKKDAALLTYYVVREAPLRYRLIVEEPIDTDRSLGRDEFIRAAVEQYARRLQNHVVEHPGDWQGWHMADRMADLVDRG